MVKYMGSFKLPLSELGKPTFFSCKYSFEALLGGSISILTYGPASLVSLPLSSG